MTDKQIKVGDVVAWDKVPSGAMVRVRSNDFALRLGDLGHWVCLRGEIKMDWARVGAWGGWTYDDGEVVDEGPCTIIKLDVPANATAEHLRALAEVYEVREAWRELTSTHDDEENGDDALQAAAEHLHAAGWRPGMTAEDAARLLAEAG